ncbi:MAG: metallophosphoesterase [Alkalibacterium sp.]|nr:metallophosphoesterase [Alkalibacterium sp.]TVP90692.1 MAG: phosphohydrolase [Alkalibacterium sp.]
MRIGTVSDLHIDRNRDYTDNDLISTFSEVIQNQEIDVLLIAGDVSNHYLKTDDFLKRVQDRSSTPIVFVPGNHDYWARDHEVTDTNQINNFFNQQEYSLVGQPRLLNSEWAVVGSPGWYDYGYGNTVLYDEEAFSRKQYGFASWNDRHYVNWGKSDQKVSHEMLVQLYKDLETVKDKKIILMTHVATHPEFVMPLPHRVYNYANAFLGAKAYESLYADFPSIEYSIMGHVHFRKVLNEQKKTLISACIGNHKHWKIKDFKAQLVKSLVSFDIT